MSEEKSAPRRPFGDFIPEDAWQHAEAARAEMRKSLEALLPPEFAARRRAARREMLLAARSFINAALERLEK